MKNGYIIKLSWGKLKIWIDKEKLIGKNCFLIKEKKEFQYLPWNWNLDITKVYNNHSKKDGELYHQPGISQEAIDFAASLCKCDILIISTGQGINSNGRGELPTVESLIQITKRLNVTIIQVSTQDGIEIWNTLLSDDLNIVFMVHTTC